MGKCARVVLFVAATSLAVVAVTTISTISAKAVRAGNAPRGSVLERGIHVGSPANILPTEYNENVSALNVTVVGTIELGTEFGAELRDVDLVGDHAYIVYYEYGTAHWDAQAGEGRYGIFIVDISNPQAMRLVAQVETPNYVSDVKVADSIAVLGLHIQNPGDAGLIIIDISDPENPEILSEFSDPSWDEAHNIRVYQDRVFVAHMSAGITIVDIADPRQPFVSGTWRVPYGGNIHDVFLRDGMAALSDVENGLVLLDVTDPDDPSLLSVVRIPEGIHYAWIEGDYVYCNSEAGGWETLLHAINVSDTRRPVEVKTFRAYPPPFRSISGPHHPHVEDDLVYWSYNQAGFRVFDISVPDHPVEIGYYGGGDTVGRTHNAHPHTDGLIYVADRGIIPRGDRPGRLTAFRFHEPAYAIRQVALSQEFAVAGGDAPIMVKARTVSSPRGVGGQIVSVSARLVGEEGEHFGEWILHDDGVSGDTVAGDGEFTGQIRASAGQPTGRYRLQVQVEDDQGRIYPYDVPFDVLSATAVLKEYEAALPPTSVFLRNTPNPFNSETVIRFVVPEETLVSLIIHNLSGQVIRTLAHEHTQSGAHEIRWDGTDDSAIAVASGVYFYRIQAGTISRTKRMTLLR